MDMIGRIRHLYARKINIIVPRLVLTRIDE